MILLAVVVDERPDPAPGRTGDERVADLERAPLDEQVGDRATADVEVRLEHDAARPAVGRGPEVLELGDDQQVLEQVVDADALQRRHRHHDGVAAPRLGHEALLGELLHDAVRGRRSRGRSC